MAEASCGSRQSCFLFRTNENSGMIGVGPISDADGRIVLPFSVARMRPATGMSSFSIGASLEAILTRLAAASTRSRWSYQGEFFQDLPCRFPRQSNRRESLTVLGALAGCISCPVAQKANVGNLSSSSGKFTSEEVAFLLQRTLTFSDWQNRFRYSGTFSSPND